MYKYRFGFPYGLLYSCIFHPCIFDRIAFSTPACSVAPFRVCVCVCVCVCVRVRVRVAYCNQCVQILREGKLMPTIAACFYSYRWL